MRPWCTQGLGLSYGWIQREHWCGSVPSSPPFSAQFRPEKANAPRNINRNVGPFRYWTLLQLPNFLLASPVLALSLSASWAFYTRNARVALHSTLPFLPASLLPSPWPTPPRGTDRPLTAPSSPLTALALVPHLHLHTALTLLLLLSAHVQIALRVCATSPVAWWFAAELVQQRGRAGRAWERYVTWWGWVATGLWAVFLPPA